jgi:hypothetical protein
LPECPIYRLETRHQLLYHQHCSTHPFSEMLHTQLPSTASKTLALDQRPISRLHQCWLLTAIERTVPPNSVKFGGPVLALESRKERLSFPSYLLLSEQVLQVKNKSLKFHFQEVSLPPDQIPRISVENDTGDSGPTPGPKIQPLNMGFGSEPCNKRPQLYLVGKIATC